MKRNLSESRVHPRALAAMENFHPNIVQEVEKSIGAHEWVVVGMRQNPVVRSARKHLTEKNVPFHYIEYGSYFSKWKERLAIKLWSGWPTFPQVFHKGRLVGGFQELKNYTP